MAALEPHFAARLAERFALRSLTVDALREIFAAHDAAYWEEWARKHDLPIVAVRDALPAS